MDNTPYTYLFIRRDLPHVTQIVQSAHAAHEAGERFGEHSHLIAFVASDENDLTKISIRLNQQGIRHQMFHEPDNDTGYTAICTEPLIGERRRLMKRYSLIK